MTVVPQAELRRFRRFQMACPIAVHETNGRCLAETATLDVSDAAVFVAMPIEAIPARGSRVTIRLSVPRPAPEARTPEEFETRAVVVRHQPMQDSRLAGVAMLFDEPLPLRLEA